MTLPSLSCLEPANRSPRLQHTPPIIHIPASFLTQTTMCQHRSPHSSPLQRRHKRNPNRVYTKSKRPRTTSHKGTLLSLTMLLSWIFSTSYTSGADSGCTTSVWWRRDELVLIDIEVDCGALVAPLKWIRKQSCLSLMSCDRTSCRRRVRVVDYYRTV